MSTVIAGRFLYSEPVPMISAKHVYYFLTAKSCFCFERQGCNGFHLSLVLGKYALICVRNVYVMCTCVIFVSKRFPLSLIRLQSGTTLRTFIKPSCPRVGIIPVSYIGSCSVTLDCSIVLLDFDAAVISMMSLFPLLHCAILYKALAFCETRQLLYNNYFVLCTYYFVLHRGFNAIEQYKKVIAMYIQTCCRVFLECRFAVFAAHVLKYHCKL